MSYWVITRYVNDAPQYWTPSTDGSSGTWKESRDDAIKFADQASARVVILTSALGQGRSEMVDP